MPTKTLLAILYRVLCKWPLGSTIQITDPLFIFPVRPNTPVRPSSFSFGTNDVIYTRFAWLPVCFNSVLRLTLRFSTFVLLVITTQNIAGVYHYFSDSRCIIHSTYIFREYV